MPVGRDRGDVGLPDPHLAIVQDHRARPPDLEVQLRAVQVPGPAKPVGIRRDGFEQRLAALEARGRLSAAGPYAGFERVDPVGRNLARPQIHGHSQAVLELEGHLLLVPGLLVPEGGGVIAEPDKLLVAPAQGVLGRDQVCRACVPLRPAPANLEIFVEIFVQPPGIGPKNAKVELIRQAGPLEPEVDAHAPGTEARQQVTRGPRGGYL